jgi:hypothetical protein
VFENRVLGRIFGPKRDELIGSYYIMRILMICTAYQILPNTIPVIKSRIIRWAEHVARMGRGKVYTGFL